VHLSDQTAKFKAFNLNEMNAISAILAESEFVCTHKDCGFPILPFLLWYLLFLLLVLKLSNGAVEERLVSGHAFRRAAKSR